MGTEFDRIFREEQRRQRIVVGLITTLFIAGGFVPRTERAIFTQFGELAPPARAFAAIAPNSLSQSGGGLIGGRIFQGRQRPVLDAVMSSPVNVAPGSDSPAAPSAPADFSPGQAGDASPTGTSGSPNGSGFGPGSSFASLPGASPGVSAGGTPVDPGVPGGGGPGPGPGRGDGNPVAPVPEAPVWLMLLVGLIGGKAAQIFRRRRAYATARKSA